MRLRDAFFREVPGERQLIDYGVRTDGQPVYVAHAPISAAESDPVWTITFYKYNESNNLIETYCLVGAFSDKLNLFLDYA